ncbi:hypothetical protein [Clostridium sardiniense]|uniref:hypothetical protein n=1 Tax=Clostridium sardiniense TaxID=29369 RepID=UPI003D341DE8
MKGLLIISLYIVAVVIATMIPIKLTSYMYKKKNILINRWIYGFAGFSLMILPNLFFDNIPKTLNRIFLVIFFFLTMMFFETSRIKVEKYSMKTMFDYTWLAKRTVKKKL